MRTLNIQLEDLPKLREAVTNYQNICAGQQETLENEKRERALAAQSLRHEFKCHEATERALEQERARVRDLVGFLNTLDLPRWVDPNDNAGIGTLCLERIRMTTRLEQTTARTMSLEQELQSARDDLQQKRLLLEDLSCNLKVEPMSASIPPASESDEEDAIKTAVLVPQRKRMRN